MFNASVTSLPADLFIPAHLDFYVTHSSTLQLVRENIRSVGFKDKIKDQLDVPPPCLCHHVTGQRTKQTHEVGISSFRAPEPIH